MDNWRSSLTFSSVSRRGVRTACATGTTCRLLSRVSAFTKEFSVHLRTSKSAKKDVFLPIGPLTSPSRPRRCQVGFTEVNGLRALKMSLPSWVWISP